MYLIARLTTTVKHSKIKKHFSCRAVTGLVTFKKLISSTTDDWIDKLNHVYTVTILIILATVISTNQFVGDPIFCWVPAEFTNAYEAYTKWYCWIKNTYFVPISDAIPIDVNVRSVSRFFSDVLCVFLALFYARSRKFHMSEISASMSVHSKIPIGDVFSCRSSLTCSSFVGGGKTILSRHHARDGSKQAAHRRYLKRLLLVPPSRVSPDRSINCLWYLRRLDLDLLCAFSATCTHWDGFGEV
jgi:hypothetical protein